MSESFEDCLRDFIKHVGDLQHEDSTDCDGYWREFMKLRELQKVNKEGNDFPAEAGKKSVNIKKNRFKDIIPFDASRVCLSTVDGVEESDYINASFIKDIDGKNGYIAAQGPLPNTVNDFWRMLWEYNTEVVFMACMVQEGGKRKCEQYWPEVGESKEFGNVKVTLESEKEISQDLIKRELKAESESRVHKLIQFQYLGWADHGIPRTPSEIRKMVGKMREERIKEDVPLVIHCSAGCGRTGTICAVDFAWNLLLYRRISDGFNLFDIIKVIREQRQSMVQTPDQYELVHLVLKDLCEEMLQGSSETEYVNVGFEDEYVNIGPVSEQEPVDELYQDVVVDKTPTVEPKVVEIPEKPVIKAKPNAVPQQKQLKDNSKKTEIPTSKGNVHPPHSYENIQPKFFKTVIKVSSKSDLLPTKKPDFQAPMTTKSNQSQVSSTSMSVGNNQQMAASKPISYVGDNIYSKVDENMGLQTAHTDSSTAGQTDTTAAVDIAEYSAVDLSKKVPATDPVNQPEDAAPAIPDRKYDPQEIVESKPTVKAQAPQRPAAGLLPTPPTISGVPSANTSTGVQIRSLGSKAPVTSGVQVMGAGSKVPVTSGVQVMSGGSKVPVTSGVQVMSGGSKAPVTSGVQVMGAWSKTPVPSGVLNPGIKIPVKSVVQDVTAESKGPGTAGVQAGQQTKGTEWVRIHSSGGQGPVKVSGGSYGRKMGERMPDPAQHRVTTPVRVLHGGGGSVRDTRSATRSKPQAYDNVVVTNGSTMLPQVKGMIQTFLAGSGNKDRLNTIVSYTDAEIGYPRRVGKPKGQRQLPSKWTKMNRR